MQQLTELKYVNNTYYIQLLPSNIPAKFINVTQISSCFKKK